MTKNQVIIYGAKFEGKTDISNLEDIFKVVGHLAMSPSEKIRSAIIFKLAYDTTFCDGDFFRYIVIHNNGNKSNDKFFGTYKSAKNFISKMKNNEKYSVQKVYFRITEQMSLPDETSKVKEVIMGFYNFLFNPDTIPMSLGYEKMRTIAENLVFGK